jgi:small multidrug resistance pump
LTGWLYLVLAITLEVSGTTAMKVSEGFTKLGPAVLMGVCYGLSLTALTFALKTIEVSIAYAIWSGLGTALIAAVGMWWFREPLSALKVIALGLVILGVIVLSLSGGPQ